LKQRASKGLWLGACLWAGAWLEVGAIGAAAQTATSEPGQAASAPAPAPSQEAKPRFRAARTEIPVKVDGALEDAAWQGPPSFEMAYETNPGDNTPAPVRTEVWLAYDANHFYAAFRAHDPRPAEIRARWTDRDRAFQDDFVGVVLDPFNDEVRGFEFFANPLGVQMDLMQNDVTGSEDDSWDALWFSAGRIDEQGYTVEIAIPISSLRFPRTAGEMTWGFDSVRIYPRDQRYRLGLNKLPRGSNCYLCKIAKLDGISGITPSRNIELAPTVTSSRTDEREGFLTGDLKSGESEAEAGISARWGVTPNMTLNAAINPDFSQVEADVAQLDVNTQFALSYPEKRPFFLEGADLFETRLNAVYSRNIADPEWGLKLTGKEGKNAIGVIVAQDRRTNLLLPSSQFSRGASFDEGNLATILRYRRDLRNQSTLGFLYTGREGNDYSNRVAGVDSFLRLSGNQAFRVEALGSTTRYPAALAANQGLPEEDLSGHALRLGYRKDNERWTGNVVYVDIADRFRADLGFIPQVGYRGLEGVLERSWYPKDRPITRLTLGSDGGRREDRDGGLLSRNANFYVWGNGPMQTFLFLRKGFGDRAFAGRTFADDSWGFFAEGRPSKIFGFTLDGRFGDRVDFANRRQGKENFLAPGLRFDLGRHLRLTADVARSDFSVSSGPLFVADLAQVRATYQFNTRTFVRLVSIYEEVRRHPERYTFPVTRRDQGLANQLLFSYKINPQTVLFAGYSDNHFADGFQAVDLKQQSRTFFFKLGYAWLV